MTDAATGSSTSSPSSASGPPALHLTGGEPAPEPVVDGWGYFMAMPASVQQSLVELLAATIAESDEGALGAMVARFADGNSLDRDAAILALRSCQFLVRHAAGLDLDGSRFVEDMAALSGDDKGALRVLSSRYGPLKQQIREGLLLQALADHGKVLVDLDWRVDHIKASDRLAGPDRTVVLLALRLRDGDQMEQVRIQLTPRSIELLRRFCDRFSESA